MSARCKLVLVDDDADLRRLLELRLRDRYAVRFAGDAVVATTVIRRERPDLVLLDIGLPGGEGFLVMDRMRAIPELAGVPVIVLTAREGSAVRQRALGAGAAGFFTKPFAFRELEAAIRRTLGEPAAA